MVQRKWLLASLTVLFSTLLLSGFCLLLFPSYTTLSNPKESTNTISLPSPISAHSTGQVTFTAQAGDYITFNLIPETGFPPMPLSIMGGTITVSVYFGSQVLYSNAAQKVEGTVNLLQTGTYVFQIVNDNDFEVEFLSAPNVDASALLLHHPYTEYSQVPNTALHYYGFLLIMGAIVVGVVAVVLTLGAATKKSLTLLN
jgi:hypothetical protein